jgi:GNAT superfamily N-acetyltransferase
MLTIRPATISDTTLILDLVRELAVYERAPDAVKAAEADFARDGFGAAPKFRVVIAEWDATAAGFALFFYNYSTWEGRPGLYLEDLYVRPEFRGRGIGKELLRHLAQIAVRDNCARFEWHVLDWNEPSLRFYESLGARHLKEWLTMRVEGEALRRLAGEQPRRKPDRGAVAGTGARDPETE